MKVVKLKQLSMLMFLLVGHGPLSYAANSISLADIVSNQVVDVRLIDRCGDPIPADGSAIDRCKSQNGGPEKYPPNACEACAYDRIGDELKLAFDEVQVNDENIETYIKVVDEGGNIIYDKRIPQNSFNIYVLTRRVESWPLIHQNGDPVRVGREGKRYTVQVERRNQDDVLYTSGKLDVLVDDCNLRNEKLLNMIGDATIEHTPGFDLYLELLNAVSSRICDRIKTGLLGDAGADTFTHRCRYQCINNSFTNELIDQAITGAGTLLARTHDDVLNETSPDFHFADNWRFGNETVDSYIMLLSYITMEDNLRANGYLQCNGGLNAVDTESSIDIISQAIEESVVPVIGAALGAKLFRQIHRHLERTNRIYEELLNSGV